MSAIVIENLSPQALAELERRAAKKQRTVAEELVALVEESLEAQIDYGPPFLTIPYDLPRQGERVTVQAVPGGKRYPDWVLPESLEHVTWRLFARAG
jgi:hypothetical protein